MAKYVCAMCGKTLGMMEGLNREFPDDGKGIGLCLDCHRYFMNTVASRMEGVSGPLEFEKIQESVLEQVEREKGTPGREYVKEYFIFKESEFINGGEHGKWETCPVCKRGRNPQDRVCGNCGYIYTDFRALNQEDYAAAAVKRHEQYLKNSFYEYKVEIVMDSAFTGTLKKDELQRLLSIYAMDGWKLHSAITNEAGKTVLAAAGVGTNATVDQTILIFERCIKGQE